MEIGHLQHVWEKYRDKGVVVLGFNSADDREIADALLKEEGATYPNVLDASDAARRTSMGGYRASAVPMNYIIDREGRIVVGFTGYAKGDRRGVEALEDALAAVPGEAGKRPAGLTGTVLGRDGKPLDGAIVRLHPTLRFWKLGLRSVETRTDVDGRYELLDAPPGVYRASIQTLGRDGMVVPAGKVRLVPGERVLFPIKVADSSLSGDVVRADTGAPLTRDDLQISARNTETGESAMAWADANGRFVFRGLPPGTYAIWIFPKDPKLKAETRKVVFKGQALDGVGFKLQTIATGVLRLTIRNAAGPARDLRFGLSTGPSSMRTLHGDEVAPGVYEFELEVGERRISIASGAARIAVRIPKGATIEKTVELPG